MAVEKEDFKGRRKREGKNVSDRCDGTTDIHVYPFITVDELALYRKKRSHFESLKDNLKVEEGSFRHIKSEYRRRFKNFYEALKSSINGSKDLLGIEAIKPEASLKLEGTQEHQSEYNESFSRHALHSLNTPFDRIMNEGSDIEGSNRLQPVEKSSTPANAGSPRRHINRRPTNLKIEGDFYHLTEHAEKFIQYLLTKRAELCRTPTTLKLGTGEMESKTETTDQFQKYDNMERPTLIRKFSNLHLEGDLDIRTEKQENFQSYQIQSRPPLVKRSTNLHLEGDHLLIPEYTHQYVHYHNPERCGPILPSHNLKTARLFDDLATPDSPFGRKSPLIPFLRESYSQCDLDIDRSFKKRSDSSSRYQSHLSLNRTSSHPNLIKSALSDDINVVPRSPQREVVPRSKHKSFVPRSPHREVILQSPQKFVIPRSPPRDLFVRTPQKVITPRSPEKNAYLDFDRGPNLNVESRRTREGSGISKGEGKLFQQPEYKSAYVEFPRERPRVRKPESNFATAGEVDYLTEKKEKYREYRPTDKAKLRRTKSGQIFDDPFDKTVEDETEQAFEGAFECQPEYRKAYVDYLIREKPPPGRRRRILEIPDININDSAAADVDISSPNDNIEKTKATSKEDKLQSSLQKPSSPSSSVPSSPTKTGQPPGSNVKRSKEDAASKKKSAGQKQRVFPRSLTPSPVPPEKLRTPSPKRMGGNWRRHQFREAAASEADKGSVWNSLEADPAFFILADGVQSRRSIRNDLYKEQKWMPSWYSSEQ